MTATVIPLPVPETRLRVVSSRLERADWLAQAWMRRADEALIAYAGWLWTDGKGNPDVPGWISDKWAERVIAWWERHPEVLPQEADWPRLWRTFVDRWLRHQPEWRLAVEAALREIGEGA